MVNRASIFLYLLVSVSIILSSCNHYYYVPNEGSLLALDEKKDIKASFGLGSFLGSGGSLSSQVGYSPIKHLGIQSSFFWAEASGQKNGSTASGNGYIANGAIGSYYFFSLKKSRMVQSQYSETSGLLVDFYVGFEKGKVSNYYSKAVESHLDFNKLFIQGGLHWQGPTIGFDFAIKAGNLDFKDGILDGAAGDENLSEFQNIEENDPFDFIESSWRFHIRRKKIKFFFTQTFLSSSKLQYVNFSDRSSHIGVILDINDFFTKKEE